MRDPAFVSHPLPENVVAMIEDEPTFRLMSEDEVIAQPPPEWLLENLIAKGTIAVLYGPSGGYKTFLALDWGLSVSRGLPWYGREVEQGPVVYIAAEGIGGLGKRLRAWRLEKHRDDLSSAGFYVLSEPPDLLDEDDVTKLGVALDNLPEPPLLVVLDTYARCNTGDENSARDAGRVVRAVDELRRNTGAAILLVHHTGKDGKDERGSSALRAAADTSISLKPTDAGFSEMKCEKQKDAAAFADLWVRLSLVKAAQSGFIKVGTKITLEQNNVARIAEILSAADEPLTKSDLAREAGWNKEKTSETLRAAISDPDSKIKQFPGSRAGSFKYGMRR